MKKILLGALLGWSAHWVWSNIDIKVEMKSTRLAEAKDKIVAVPKAIIRSTPSCGTTCLQLKLPTLESSLAEKKKELKTNIEVKEPTAEQLVSLGILR